jgi:hypothetical protein
VPFSLESEGSNYGYDEDKAGDALEIIENKVKDMINRPITELHGSNLEKQIMSGDEGKPSILKTVEDNKSKIAKADKEQPTKEKKKETNLE